MIAILQLKQPLLTILLLKQKKHFSDDMINLYKVVGFDEENNLLFTVHYNSVFGKYFDIIDPREYIYIGSNPTIDFNLLEKEFRNKHTNNKEGTEERLPCV